MSRATLVRALPIVLLALYIALSLATLTAFPIVWGDEAWYSEAAWSLVQDGSFALPMFADLAGSDIGTLVFGRVHTVATAAAFAVAGPTPEAARFVSFASGMVALTALFGLGGGVIQYRVPYKECREWVSIVPSDPDGAVVSHPWYDTSLSDQYQSACQDAALDSEENGGATWTNAWNGTDWIEKSYFRKAGKLVVELGLEMNFWFVKSFGLNVGLISDVYFVPDFDLNLDFQLVPVFRF